MLLWCIPAEGREVMRWLRRRWAKEALRRLKEEAGADMGEGDMRRIWISPDGLGRYANWLEEL